MKKIIYDAITKTKTIIDVSDNTNEPLPEFAPTLDERIAVVEETLTLIAEVAL